MFINQNSSNCNNPFLHTCKVATLEFNETVRKSSDPLRNYDTFINVFSNGSFVLTRKWPVQPKLSKDSVMQLGYIVFDQTDMPFSFVTYHSVETFNGLKFDTGPDYYDEILGYTR